MALSQGTYCRRIHKRFGTERASFFLTPMVRNIDDLLKTTHDNEAEIVGIVYVLYRALVRSWLYLSCHTRMDIAFAVVVLAIFVEIPSRIHWKVGKSILWNLDGKLDHGIIIGLVEPAVEKSLRLNRKSGHIVKLVWRSIG